MMWSGTGASGRGVEGGSDSHIKIQFRGIIDLDPSVVGPPVF